MIKDVITFNEFSDADWRTVLSAAGVLDAGHIDNATFERLLDEVLAYAGLGVEEEEVDVDVDVANMNMEAD